MGCHGRDRVLSHIYESSKINPLLNISELSKNLGFASEPCDKLSGLFCAGDKDLSLRYLKIVPNNKVDLG